MRAKCCLLLIALICIAIVSTAQCGSCESLTDRIENGSFENGNTGFTSSLDYVTFFPFLCTLCPENSYAIGNNAALFHNGFSGNDHTNPPTGDFFIANAPGVAGTAVWCQTIDVLPQTTYTFTFWARDIANNTNPHPLAVLQPSFNGVLAGDSLIAEGGWNSLSVTWFSDTVNTLNVCIIDYQSETGGNDFGLDDISLTACEPIQLSQDAFAGNDTTICSRDLLSLGVIPINGYDYTWDSADNISSASIGNPIFQYDNTSGIPQSFDLSVTRDSANVGCIQSDSIHIVVLSMNPLSLGSDLSVCPNDSVLISCGNGWDSVVWSTSENSSEIWVGSGEHGVTVYSGSCSESDTIVVQPIDMPDTSLPTTFDHCNTEPLILEASVVGTWSGEGTTSDNPITISQSGTYYFNYTANNCSAIDTVTVTLFNLQEANLSADTTLCSGTTATLFADFTGNWNTGTISNQIIIDTPGLYAIEIANGPCITADSIVVAGLYPPVVNLGQDTVYCEDFPVELNAFNAGATYVWSTGDTTATIVAGTSGNYHVEATNVCGTTSDEILIETYACSWQLYVPSCFTPNEDTFNEGWSVSGYNIESIHLTVYNRFGDAVFHTTELGDTWYPSVAVGDDVYNYRIEITPFEGQREVRTGVIYLIR